MSCLEVRQGDGTLTVVEVKDALDKASSHHPCPVFIVPSPADLHRIRV